MATARRLYLYGVSGLSLGLLLVAASILMGLLLDSFALGSNTPPSVLTGVQASRESLSLAIGFIAVGLPLWLFHWVVVERIATGDGPAAAAERQSIVRGVFFGLVLFWLAAEVAASGTDLLREAVCRPLGAVDAYSSTSLSGSLSWLVVGAGAFIYHGWVRARDVRRGPTITGAAAWGSRLLFYGFALGAITAVLVSAGTVISTVGQALAGYTGGLTAPPSPYISGSGLLWQTAPAAWWVRPVVGAAAAVLVYGAVWNGHWWYAARLAARGDQQGHDERASRVRLTYFVAVVAVAVGYVVVNFGGALGVALRYVVGSWRMTAGLSLWGEVLVPPLAALPLLAGWWWHRRRAIREGLAESGSPLRATRPIDYLTSLIGLAVFGIGLSWLLGSIAQRVIDPGSGGGLDAWRTSTVAAIGMTVAAAPIWLWPWFASQDRLQIDRLGEARSTARRAFLFAVGGATVAAGAFSLAFIVYRTTRVGVGLESASFGSDVRMPLCMLIVAIPLLAYHAYWLRRDQEGSLRASGLDQAATPAEVAPEALAGAVEVAAISQELVIMGPVGADLEALRASLAERLPDGYSMAVRPSGGTAQP